MEVLIPNETQVSKYSTNEINTKQKVCNFLQYGRKRKLQPLIDPQKRSDKVSSPKRTRTSIKKDTPWIKTKAFHGKNIMPNYASAPDICDSDEDDSEEEDDDYYEYIPSSSRRSNNTMKVDICTSIPSIYPRGIFFFHFIHECDFQLDHKSGKEPLKCHQCKRNDRIKFIPCTKCEEKLYCVQCIKQW